MKFRVTDEEGRPIAFYDDAVHEMIPSGAVEISVEDWHECLAHPGCRRFDDDGALVECRPPFREVPTASEKLSSRLEKDPTLNAILALMAEMSGESMEEVHARVVARMEAS